MERFILSCRERETIRKERKQQGLVNIYRDRGEPERSIEKPRCRKLVLGSYDIPILALGLLREGP